MADPQLTTFIAVKRKQAETLTGKAERPMPKLAQDYFDAATRGDWTSATNAATRLWRVLRNSDGQPLILRDKIVVSDFLVPGWFFRNPRFPGRAAVL